MRRRGVGGARRSQDFVQARNPKRFFWGAGSGLGSPELRWLAFRGSPARECREDWRTGVPALTRRATSRDPRRRLVLLFPFLQQGGGRGVEGFSSERGEQGIDVGSVVGKAFRRITRVGFEGELERRRECRSRH